MGDHVPVRLASRVWLPLAGCVCAMLVRSPAGAHVADNYESVHFHSGMVDFGTVPRRARLMGEHDDREVHGWGMDEVDRSGIELTREGDENREQARDRIWKKHRADADLATQAGDWAGARRAWGRIASKLGVSGTVRDRLEVLGRVVAMRRPLDAAFPRAPRLYLEGLTFDDGRMRKEALAAFQAVSADRAAGFLREHALYQEACLAWEWWDYRGAVDQLRRFLDSYPRTVKRESALMMIARCAILPRTAESQQLDVGRWAIGQIEKGYPRTRFRRSIAGLRARLLLLDGKTQAAADAYFALDDLDSVDIVRRTLPREKQSDLRVRLLAGHLLRLARARSFGEYYFAIKAIRRAREHMTADEAHRFGGLLLARPEVASPYLYYRLYHTENKRADLRNLAELADTLAARHSASRLAPAIRTRLAEVYYQHREYGKSVEWAGRALAAGGGDRALFVRGASLQKVGKYGAALADFTELLARYPSSPLRRGAREMSAIVLELMGDLAGALDQYFDLGYAADVAFLLDMRMSIPEIENLLKRHKGLGARYDQADWGWRAGARKGPGTTRRDLVEFSLGIRCLRESRFDDAERMIRDARTDLLGSSRRYWSDSDMPTKAGMLRSIRQLRRLRAAIASAKSDERKADALYRYATYVYKGSDLLFYNVALWRGERAGSFSFCWNKHHATHDDVLAARDHHYRHEIFARAEEACLEIARIYPHTKVAPQALYRAACCERKLANFNGWWREDCKRVDHGYLAARYMRRMAALYPRSPLAHAARKYAAVFAHERAKHYYDW